MIGLVLAVTLLTNGVTPAETSATQKLTDDQKIIHVLNRLGYGPRPGDVERVKKLGLHAYIEQQLHPETIEDKAVEAKTAAFDSLKLSGTEIAEMERNAQMANQQLRQLQKSLAERGAMEGANAIQGAVNAAQTGTQPPPAQQLRNVRDVLQNATPEERKMLQEGRMMRQRVNSTGTELVMNKVIRAAESEKQLYEVLVDFWSNHFNIDATKVRASKVVDEQQVIRPHVMGKFRDLLNASATSAAMMLYLDNAQSTAVQPIPERPQQSKFLQNLTLDQLKQAAQNGRPQAVQMLSRLQQRAKEAGVSEEEAFSRFKEMLDGQPNPANPQAPRRARGGLNENYARELMELHTLGVDGGYTQKDVTEVARCLTGWGTRGGRFSGEFEFHPRLHDSGEKVVLGKTIPAGGGMEDGKMVLDMLASHPSTMRFISTKLCRRFVSDNPPKSLVDRCVETWKRTDGDIREIVRTIVTSNEFFSKDAYKSKIKSPFEYAISSVRALGATIEAESAESDTSGRKKPPVGLINVFAPNGTGQVNPRLLCGQIGTLGQPLYNYGFPTGYPEESTKWVSSGALIGRINFALSLTNGRIADVDLSHAVLADESIKAKPVPQLVDSLSRSLLGAPLTSKTRSTLINQLTITDSTKPSVDLLKSDPKVEAKVDKKTDIMDDSQDESRRVAALVLGSPEFQRR